MNILGRRTLSSVAISHGDILSSFFSSLLAVYTEKRCVFIMLVIAACVGGHIAATGKNLYNSAAAGSRNRVCEIVAIFIYKFPRGMTRRR